MEAREWPEADASAAQDGRRRSRHAARNSYGSHQPGYLAMSQAFKVGDHVSWNSEAGRVSGTIIAVHTRDFDYKGYTHHASKDDPQYEIRSNKTDHVAAHKGGALRHCRDD
jgi:hypothetical protein